MTAEATRRADARARRVAQTEFERHLLVQAGAGTGKTRVLVGRIVAWCLGPGWERHAAGDDDPDAVAARVLSGVVAITFTEAAAAEMAARVAGTLREVRDAQPSPGFEGAEAVPEATRRQRAVALLAALDRLTVATIHAWCRALLSEHALEAGLDPGFEVDADETLDAQVVRAVVERFLRASLASAPPRTLLELSRRGVGPGALERALLDLVRAGALPETLEVDPLDPARLARCHATLDEALCRLGRSTARLAGVRGARTRSAAEALARSLEVLESTPTDPSGLARLRERLADAWSDPRDLVRLRDWSRGKLGRAEAEALGAGLEEVAPAAMRAHALLVHLLGLDVGLLLLVRDVLRPLLAEAQRELRARGVQTYAALLRDARRLVVERPGVAARVRLGIDQLLVDEFQDTDGSQCRLLRALALEGPREERPVLFVVGDPKQSIYGWRDADLRAFHRFRGEVEAAGGELLTLAVNFRSPAPLLDEVERMIRPAMREEPGVQPAFERLLVAPQHEGDRGFEAGGRAPVEHWVSWGFDAEAGTPAALRAREAAELEARAVAADLVELHEQHGVAWRDVALLFRGTGDFEVYLAALREAGVPSVVERDRSFHRRREILDAGALVRCLLDPNDQVALVAWLRSPAVGVPDAALLPLWRAGLPTLVRSLHGGDDPLLVRLRACVETAVAELPSDVPGIERIAGWEQSLLAALAALARARAWFDEEPADVFVERIRRLFAVELVEGARYLGGYRAANLDRFFRRLNEALERCGGNVSAVLAELRGAVCEAREETEGRPRDPLDDAVQVMTIHRAKGLDFEHVYLLQHHKGRGTGSGEAAARLAVGAALETPEYWLAHPSASTPGFGEAALAERAVEAAELVRTLYVAATRARQRLVVVGDWPRRGRRPLASAESHAALLAHRSELPGDLEATMAALAASGAWRRREGSALWVFPALRPAATSRARRLSPRPPSLARLRAESRATLSARGAAAERSAQARVRAASSSAEDARRAFSYEPDASGAEPRGARREVARATGTAVHRALEELEPSGDPARDAASCLEAASAELAQLEAPERERALAGAREVIEAFVGGPLYERLAGIAPHVVARELPVLVPPESGPPGALVGTLDLVYRDPDDGCLVVVDYKTDRVEDDAAHAERYRGQGAIYTRALHEALGLDTPPRFELWFLRTGRAIASDVGPGGAPGP